MRNNHTHSFLSATLCSSNSEFFNQSPLLPMKTNAVMNNLKYIYIFLHIWKELLSQLQIYICNCNQY